MRSIRLIPASAIALLAVVFGSLAAPNGPQYDDLRSMGMGGTTVAVTTDRTAIFHNPAGLGMLKDAVQISVRPAVVGFDRQLFSDLKILMRNKNAFSNVNDIDTNVMKDLDKIDGQWALLQYMPEITMAKKNLGFGVYSVMPFNARLESGHFIPKLGFKGQRDLVFTWAVGIPLKNKNNFFGISLAYLQRTPLDERITSYSETFSYANDLGNNMLSAFGILDNLAVIQHGAAFSVGFMHNLKGFRIGWDVKDLFAVVGGKMVIPRLDLGCAYYFPKIEKVKIIRNIIISAEASNLIGFEDRTGRYEQFPKKLHAGAEIDLKYLALRGGINQGYPTFGVGVAFGPLKIDYVYYTSEGGYYAGQLPVGPMHVFSLGFEINAGKRRTGPETSSVNEEPAKAEPAPAVEEPPVEEIPPTPETNEGTTAPEAPAQEPQAPAPAPTEQGTGTAE